VLEAIDLDRVHSRGYAFQIELTYRAVRAGFTIVEVPIRFVDRTAGSSKMSRAIVLEAIWKVPLLRLRAVVGRL
jgi:dolichol-phosphate mannosyltransferase